MTVQTSSTTAAAAAPHADTLASQLAANPAIEQAVEAIVNELKSAQASITGVRPASESGRANLQQWLDRLAETRGKPAWFPYVGSGLGNGPLVELEDGSIKYDLINGIGVHMFGHSEPDLVATAIRAALSDVIMQGNLQYNADSIAFAELLVNEAAKSSDIKHCFLTNSGTMANEAALKICQHKREGKAPRVIAFADCFMGRSTAMTQIGDSAKNRPDLPLNVQVDYMPFYDPEHGDRSIDYARWHLQQYIERYPGQHACFVMELVQGEGGFNVAPREFFVPLMEMCQKHGIPVWIDEVQTFGRTQEMFHFQELELGQYVDVVTMGKMSQVCGCLYTEDIKPAPTLLSGTFIGSSVALQVGRRALERLRDGGYYGPDGHITKLHEAFRDRARKLVDDHPDWFPEVPHPLVMHRQATGVYGGIGGMMRLTPFAGNKNKIIKAVHKLYEQGVISFYCGHAPYHLRFLPPIGVMQPEQFDDVFAIIEKTFAEVAREE